MPRQAGVKPATCDFRPTATYRAPSISQSIQGDRTDAMARETFTFQTEVGRLLDIVAHSLYSHKEIFLRELVSNASDACDRLRYAALTDPALSGGDTDFKIRLEIDRAARTLSVSDNGIGMSREELVETLGTIARSGTQAFLCQPHRRRQEGRGPDRPVRRRLLFGLHGRRHHRRDHAAGRRGQGLAVVVRRQGLVHASTTPSGPGAAPR